MKLKRFYQYVESKNYNVESVLKHPTHNETFFNMLVGANYDANDRTLFSNILHKNLHSDLVSEGVRNEILEYFNSNELDAQMFLNEGFFDKLKQSWDTVKDKAKEVSTQAKEVLGNIIEKAKNAVDFVKKVKDYVADAFKRLIQVGVEKIRAKLKVDKAFTARVQETAQRDKEGLKKDLIISHTVTDFYKNKLLAAIGNLIQKNVPETIDKGESAPEEGVVPDGGEEILKGQKYMYLNSKGDDIEVTVVDDADKDLVQVTSANSAEPFKVKKEKLRLKEDGFLKPEEANKPANEPVENPVPNESFLYNDGLKLNENIIGDLIHKIEAIPPFSWLHRIKDIGEKGANIIISILSDVTGKLGGPKFVLPVIASLLGLALEYNIKGLAKGGLVDTAAYFTVPFLIPVIKFIGYVATFIAVMIAINDIANMGIIGNHDKHGGAQPAEEHAPAH